MIEAGIKKGDILRGPPSIRFVCSRSIMSNPPMPDPICTPTRSAISSVTERPAIFIASSDAARAKWMKRPIFFTSFFSMKFSGSKPLTSAAIWQACCEVSKCVMRVTPLLPARRFCQVSSVVLPTAEISPIPVTTTRLCKLLSAFRVLADVVDGVFYGADLLGILIGDLDVEGLFECHYQFNRVERIGAEVIHERSVWSNFGFVDA